MLKFAIPLAAAISTSIAGIASFPSVSFADSVSVKTDIPPPPSIGGASEASVSTSKPLVSFDDLYFNLFTIYHGQGVTTLDEPFTQDPKGKLQKGDNGAVYLDNEFTAAYMVTDTIGIGPDIPFFVYPVLGKTSTLGDVGIKIFNRKLISAPNFNIYGNIIFQLPTSDYSQAAFRSMKFAIKSTPAIRWSIPTSRFTVGSWNELKWYANVVSGKVSKYYAAPYVNYQLSPRVSLNIEYEMEFDHMYGKPTWDLSTYETDWQPGFVFIITPKIMLNPYLQVYTTDKISMNNTGVGAIISASL